MKTIILFLMIISNIYAINLGVTRPELNRYIPPINKTKLILTKMKSIPIYITEIINGDQYKCKLILPKSNISQTYIINIANISCNNILSSQSIKLISQHILNKSATINIYQSNNDTIIGDIEYEHPITKQKTSAAQTIIQNGLSPYIKEYNNISLQLLQEKAIDNQRGIWHNLDPIKIKFIQDSISIFDKHILDSIIQDIIPIKDSIQFIISQNINYKCDNKQLGKIYPLTLFNTRYIFKV
jgi:hypothetical protein